MHLAQKFEHLVDTYRHADGRKWTGAELNDATGGVVTRSYVTNLRKGRIENPGYEKLAAMAKAMGFAPEVWFDERLGEGSFATTRQAADARGLSGRLEHLFEVVRNPKTGEPYSSAEVARMTLGDLSQEDVERIRTGAVSDPTVSQVAALASVFGVEPSYLFDREEPSLLDEELVKALRDADVRDITRESSRLPDKERQLVLGIVRQFRNQKAAPST
jgi:transcriptional regulator with XRE-family HTH domain